mgnify:CR=1 FL=1
MKCPKCGYLGFETTDRCRNCQYDFSLAPAVSDPELSLHDRRIDTTSDLELPIRRQADSPSSTALDLDRLFGEAEPARTTAAPTVDAVHDDTVVEPPVDPQPPVLVAATEAGEAVVVDVDRPPAEDVVTLAAGQAQDAPPVAAEANVDGGASTSAPAEDDALPFDDVPLVPPPAARTPLAVRRSQPDLPRARHRTTRPVRMESLKLEPPSEPETRQDQVGTIEPIASILGPPSLGVRLGAGVIDVLLMAGLFATVMYLTLRVAGLQNTYADLRLLPRVPFLGFLGLIAFGYNAAFTVGGGQTIGKMMLNLRVIGDDGRPIDAAGGVLRAVGALLVPITFGLSYLPALLTSDHRALHDRLAGTRVVQE